METWFTSDNHFGHKGILKFCPDTRPVRDLDEMTETMIDVWNATVRPTDHVWIVGDFSFYSSVPTMIILYRLNGILHLVKGNHDKAWLNGETSVRFQEICDYKSLKLNKQHIIMFHFPIYEWDRMHHGSWHLHGHTHGNVHLAGKVLDVGIDNRPEGDMRLWSFEEIKEYMDNRPIIERRRD